MITWNENHWQGSKHIDWKSCVNIQRGVSWEYHRFRGLSEVTIALSGLSILVQESIISVKIKYDQRRS